MKKVKLTPIFDKKQMSLRLRSEFNDLKRTPLSVANELNIDKSEIDEYLSGNYNLESYFKFLIKFCRFYPVNMSDLIIQNKDTKNGLLFFSNKKSRMSSRVFSRKNKNGNLTPYYEYRDTAKSNLSHFYPEWISQIRYVKDSDPNNSDVVFNNGHFLHQLNLFVGPVNYYYEIRGKKYCIEMNTGDTSYISPFVKHSFTNRDQTKLAYIVAVTTGSGLKRNQNELRRFGKSFLNKIILKKKNEYDYFKTVINKAIKNEILNKSILKKKLGNKLFNKIINKKNFMNLKINDIKKVSEVLNISTSDFFFNFHTQREVVDKFFIKKDFHYFPSNSLRCYKIYKSARSINFSNLKGFILNVISDKKPDLNLEFSLNLYLINFGLNSVNYDWEYNNVRYNKVLKPGDSLFIEPYIKFCLYSNSKDGLIYLVTSEISTGFETQKEISSIRDFNRIINDKDQWFSGSKNE